MRILSRVFPLEKRVERLLSSPRVAARPFRDVPWSAPYREPPDLGALYARCDGLTTDNGFTMLGRGEIHDATRWLVLDRALGWPDDVVVIGERTSSVVVLDLDVHGARAGGGVLEAASDDLEGLFRVASDAVAYASLQIGGDDPKPPPEVAARRAVEASDADSLQTELGRPWYPGGERLLAPLWLELGAIRAKEGDSGRSLGAFERSVEARAGLVRRGAERDERVAAWKAALHAARSVGAESIAAACAERVAALT